MQQDLQRCRPFAGFSILELTIALSIIVLLTGILTPFVYRNKTEAQAASLLATIDGLRAAVTRYYIDNGSFPVEKSDGTDPSDHNLFSPPANMPNWSGPYISKPLDKTASPATNTIQVLSGFAAGVDPGPFTVDGAAVTGQGCTLVVYGVSEEVASLVDQHFDKGARDNWDTEGYVLFSDPDRSGSGGMTLESNPSISTTGGGGPGGLGQTLLSGGGGKPGVKVTASKTSGNYTLYPEGGQSSPRFSSLKVLIAHKP